MGNRSDEAYWSWSESSEKFDYYVCGLAAAVVVFAVRDLGPGVVAYSPYGLKLLSIAVLLFGIVFGLKRLECINMIKLYQHRRLYNQEKLGELRQVPPGCPAINNATGDILHPDACTRETNRSVVELNHLSEFEDKLMKKAGRYYKLRNRGLAIGVIGSIAAEVWVGYIHAG